MSNVSRFWSIGFLAFAAIVQAADPVSFNRDIRPILSDNCFACHGPDEHGRAAGLRLDQRQAAMDSGAIVPGKSEGSEIIVRVLESNPESAMPPPKSGKKLKPDQIVLLKRWIDEGAKYQSHWSFEPIPKQVVAPQTSSWGNSELDAFVHQEIVAHEFSPSPEAARSQWLRRVCMDLIGLPPTLEQLDRFVNNRSQNAYELMVDELLASKHYGERMANMWCDVARYADTFGYQSDIAMEVWPWRDWVINAFNSNMPYDEFIRQQTAGDLLPNPTRDNQLATAFNRLHRQTNEGGSIDEEFRQANIADRTSTNSTAFLGLTFECARCHDHKYDPISKKDFYSLAAFFSNIDELGLYSHFTFSAPTPALALYQGNQESEHKAVLAEITSKERAYHRAIQDALENAPCLLSGDSDYLPEPPKPDYAFPLDDDSEGVIGNGKLCNGDDEVQCKDVKEFGRTDPFSLSIWVKPAVQQARMLVLHQSVAAEDSGVRGSQWTIDNGHPEFSLIHFWPGNALRVEATETIPIHAWSHLTVVYDGSSRASGVRLFINGRAVQSNVERDQLTRDIRHRKEWNDMKVGDVHLALGARFRDIGFRDGLVDDLRVYRRPLSDAEVASIFLDARSKTEVAQVKGIPEIPSTESILKQHYANSISSEVQAALAELTDARRKEDDLFAQVREIMTMRTAVLPRKTYILERGDYTMPKEEVQPATPHFMASDFGASQDRLGLAHWLTSSNNPLVARVIVNRYWHLFFGRGIVVSLEDFGSQGTPPSHPELLDYLARGLIDDGWNLKNLCKRIVLSATYRQSSIPADPKSYERDPGNQWLARGPKHRLSAEQVRDVVLAASGLLVPTIGGPSVMPYQPAGLWEEAGTGKKYNQSKGDGLYRRSLYTFWKRTSPPPSMVTFDATTRETCTAKREVTTTPLQALVLLNDPQFVEASRVLAESLIKSNATNTEARWQELFRKLLSRPPDAREMSVLERLYQDQKLEFEANHDAATQFVAVGDSKPNEQLDVVDLAATAVVVEAVISYDETQMKR